MRSRLATGHRLPTTRSSGIISLEMGLMRHRILLAASFLYVAVANLLWIARDTRPPFWDMAFHQTAALRVFDEISQNGLRALSTIPQLTSSYPPLYHIIVAAFYAAFGRTIDAAQLANLAAIAILFVAAFAIGRTLLPPVPAAVAAILVNFYPILIWLSRETLIDYWLASFVALAMYFLIRADSFSRRRESAMFGVVCGLGMLTKWTFGLFVALPGLWAARKNWKNASFAGVIALVVSGYWYLSQWHLLIPFWNQNTAGGVMEGDPGRASWQAVVFYIRAMEGYQLFLPLFLLFVGGAILLARNYRSSWTPIVLWILSGWAGLMLFQNKDPRYAAPLLPAVALVSATVFKQRQLGLVVLFPFLLFQHYLVSFGVRHLPETIVLTKGIEGPLSWNWNLYTQSYFGLWGAPAREDWQIERVLDRVTSVEGQTVRLGMIPDIPRFDALAFEFYIALRKEPVVIHRLWAFDEPALWNNDYVLMSEKGQGFAEFFSRDLKRINRYILDRPERFEVLEWFPLPNGEVIRLYKVRGS